MRSILRRRDIFQCIRVNTCMYMICTACVRRRYSIAIIHNIQTHGCAWTHAAENTARGPGGLMRGQDPLLSAIFLRGCPKLSGPARHLIVFECLRALPSEFFRASPKWRSGEKIKTLHSRRSVNTNSTHSDKF